MAYPALNFQQTSSDHQILPSEKRKAIANVYAIYAEYLDLCGNPCDGIFALPSEQDAATWLGTLTLINGPYDGAVFRFTLSFSSSIQMPELPRFRFGCSVFHPLVDPKTGEFDLSSVFPQWSNKIRMRRVLQAVREAFAVIDTNGRRNPEAGTLYRASPKDFRTRVTMDIVTSMHDLTEENAPLSNSQMNFGPWIPALHEPILKEILENGAVILEKNKVL